MADGPARSRRVAAFDVDGTIVPGDSLIRFVARAAGVRRLVRAVGRHGPRVLWAVWGRGNRDAAKAAFVATALRGLRLDHLTTEADGFAARMLARARPQAMERLAWHHVQEHEVVLVSASLCLYLEPLAQRLGCAAVLATGVEVDEEGVLTGRLLGANVRGPEKVERLRAWLGDGPSTVWAYGDSAGDRDLLEFADQAYLYRRGEFRPVA